MWTILFWNTISAAAMAAILKLASYSRWLQSRPTWMNLGWCCVLGKLIAPALIALPIWTTTVSKNYFRSIDSSTGHTQNDLAQPSQATQATQATSRTSQVVDTPSINSKETPTAKEDRESIPMKLATMSDPWMVYQELSIDRLSWTPLTSAWLFGSSLFIFAWLWRRSRVRHLLRFCREEPELTQLTRQIGTLLGCRKIPRVAELDGNISPALIGTWRPIIVVPKWVSRELSKDQIIAILAHELSHYHRRDHWSLLIHNLIQSLLWWNPIAWWATRELRQWQELSCDAMVVSQGGVSAKTYGETLWRIVQKLHACPTMSSPSLAVACRSNRFVRHRFQMLLQGAQVSRATQMTRWGILCMLFLLLCYPSTASFQQLPTAFRYEAMQDLPQAYCEIASGWPSSIPPENVLPVAWREKVVARAHFWFGNSDRPVLVAIIQASPTQNPTLLVDCDRNEKLDEKDKATLNADGSWLSLIQSFDIVNDGQRVRSVDRDILYRVVVRQVEGRLEIAHSGLLKGIVECEGKSVAATIEDVNCNGQWTDKEDRLNIDWNQDGKFTVLRERFSCQSLPTFGGKRYSLAYQDDLLTLKRLEGTGSLKPTLQLLDSGAQLEEIQAVLASSDGIHITFQSLAEPIELPVGRYTVKSLRFKLRNDRAWFASFQQSNMKNRTTVNIQNGSMSEFDLLGDLKLEATLVSGNLSDSSTEQLVVQPMIYSDSGLYLARCTMGKDIAQDDCLLTASLIQLGQERRLANMSSTGFACGAFCPISLSAKDIGGNRAMISLSFDSGPLAGP